MLAPWLAVGAGLGALTLIPDPPPVQSAGAITLPVTVSSADPSVLSFAADLADAPPMALAAPPPGPAIRFMVSGPSIAGFVSVATDEDNRPEPKTHLARINQIFTVPGKPIKPLPEGFYHPLISASEEALPEGSALPDPETTTSEVPYELLQAAGRKAHPITQSGPTPEQWAALRWCESSGNYEAANFSGKYRGAYQFDVATWESVGGSGDPAAADPTEQDRLAKILYETRGTSPWPYCGRYLHE